MFLFRIQYLIISSMALVLSSCALHLMDNADEVPLDRPLVNNPYFADAEKDYIYRASLEFKEFRLGGILMVKKIANDHHRVVFTSEFGNKLFDFEYVKGQPSVHHILQELDRKPVLRLLHLDLRTLMKEQISVDKQYKVSGHTWYTSRSNNYKILYGFDTENIQMDQILIAKGHREKVMISFKKIVESDADSISIVHLTTRLNVNLSRIK